MLVRSPCSSPKLGLADMLVHSRNPQSTSLRQAQREREPESKSLDISDFVVDTGTETEESQLRTRGF